MAKLKTINIHGKQYVEVNERIKYFRETFKDWSLTSEVIDLSEDRCVIKASITNEKDKVIATGIAYEMQGSSFINKTSFVENCETSAWGRALGNLGIGIETSIASAEEIKNAKKQQKDKPKTKLDEAKLQAMIVAIGEGKISVVQERMNNYKLTKKQKETLNTLILEMDLKIKEKAKFNSITEINEGLAATMLEYNDLQ
tara:strand:- start:3698 stop:4294 length:597 start_codon:yes stop_codon:yes gene_type:complete